ncbi:MAG: sodium-dependent transporter [Fusobacterium sp.]|uniref:sodium-dependent transporter n=1 Tax=Fusobacterium sp. TaxID=68766 RepID=UPI0026DC746B|nr:sodium-dependent transporter [Fusobacterium sp.]MDO4690687.1 sodium-dependent transporter [Fusobacterium sp.]
MAEIRENFKTKSGFILACIGSAVGMGNIWLFPYKVGQLGGAAFIIPYFIFIILLGFSGVIEEMALGRAMQTGPLGAFKKALELRGKSYGEIIGLIPVIGSLGIAVGYSVVVGWILKFTIQSFTGAVTSSENSGAFFGAIAGKYGSLGWHIAALVLVILIMNLGVGKGIEKVNKIMMPLFFFMFLFLALRVFFLPNSFEGYKFLFQTDWSKLANPKTWVFALGQAFFSLSLAGSGTVVYGSYLKKDEDIVNSAIYVSIFDTMAAMLAALVIIPAVFAYGVEPSAGPPLMFIVMPEIFKKMPLGILFSSIFFLAVLFAAITSLINLFETPIEALQNKFKLSRFSSVLLVMGLGAIVAIYLEDGNILGSWMDFISIYIIPLGALLAAIVFYWVCGDKFAYDAIMQGSKYKDMKFLIPLGKYLFCGLTLFVIIAGIIYNGIG